jgi:hypothetical protein
MIGRVFAASLTLALGLLFGSAVTFAKPGGFSIKAGGLSAKSGGLSGRHAHPFHRVIPKSPVFLPPVVPPFSVGHASASPTRLLRPIAPSYRRVFGYRLPAAGIGVYYGANSTPFDDFGAYAQSPVVTSPSPNLRTAEFARRCTETQIVPSEEGGERSITIRRC